MLIQKLSRCMTCKTIFFVPIKIWVFFMSQPTFEGIWKSVPPKKGYIENEINLRFLGSKQSLPYCKRVPLINLEPSQDPVRLQKWGLEFCKSVFCLLCTFCFPLSVWELFCLKGYSQLWAEPSLIGLKCWCLWVLPPQMFAPPSPNYTSTYVRAFSCPHPPCFYTAFVLVCNLL